jgi:hypothetical protein
VFYAKTQCLNVIEQAFAAHKNKPPRKTPKAYRSTHSNSMEEKKTKDFSSNGIAIVLLVSLLSQASKSHFSKVR